MKPFLYMRETLAEIRDRGLHGINLTVPDGFLRGVEVFGDDLDQRMLASLKAFQARQGRLPEMVDPISFADKQFLFKFFAPVPTTPSPSDKLRSAVYLPQDAVPLLRRTKVIWRGPEPRLPGNDEIAPGTYWLKSNHGSGTNCPVTYPLSDTERETLEARAAAWLKKDHHPRLALWWYDVIDRQVYLEEDLRLEGASAADWKFFVCNGRVILFQHDADRHDNHVQTIYTRSGRYLPEEMYFPGGAPVEMPDNLEQMVKAAEAIGRHFDFIRVDLFHRDGAPYLGEIALVPNGCTAVIRSPKLDGLLGGSWRAPWLGDVDQTTLNAHYASLPETSGHLEP